MHHTTLPQTEFNAVLNSIPDILIRLSLNGKILWWNKNLDDVLSKSKDELLSSHFTDLFEPYSGKSILNIIDDTVGKGKTEVDAYLRVSEVKKLYHLKCTLIENSSEEKEVLIVARDVDERSQMSIALKKSQTQLQKLIDALPFLVFLITVEGEYLIANKKFCDFVGLEKDKIIGCNSKDVIGYSMLENFTRDNNKILLDKCPVHYETSLELDKKNINLSVDKFPLFNNENNIYAICGVIEDVTAQYHLQRQLQQTQKMDAIGQLTGGIAHDFNNVLASIMGYAGLTKRHAKQHDDETITGYLNQITRAGERARDLVQQLLAFSRGDVGGLQVLEPEPLVNEAISMLSSLIPSSINLNFNNNNLKKHIEVDPVQFNQSVMNLVINSKDAIGDKVGVIDVSLKYLIVENEICDSCHTKFSGSFIQLTVSDSGSGISKSIMDRVFDPFFTTKDIGKGAGMGLSMLHGIVHGSGGHITVQSGRHKTKVGTTIQVFFPEVVSPNIEEQPGVYELEKAENKNEGKKILVIDDEPLIANYLTDLLIDEGYIVESYTDPKDGLKYFYDNSENIDLVITDQTMPRLTGIELAKEIFESGYATPVILCSGYSEFATESNYENSGIDVFLEKPFDDDLLFKNISRLFNQ